MKKIIDFVFNNVFYLKRMRVVHRPPKLANVYWSIFTVLCILFILSTFIFWGSFWLVYAFWSIASMFFIGESSALAHNRIPFVGRASTYSEWIWWYVRNPYPRLGWGYLLAVMTMIHWGTIPGTILAIWLTLHFALRGRE